ncbi:MAG: FAD-binding oxidoreductase [Pseudazoarcus pumilus]|nr:FAD-binding oxidoreductase [Pseudazoarcus pumilus]
MMQEADLLARLVKAVGPEHVLADTAAKQPWLTDWRGRYRGEALAVVFPQSVEAVSEVVRACVSAGVAVVPQGGNTGLCGGATPLQEGRSVVVNLSRMNRVRAVDAANNALVVEAGCTLATVQQIAEQHERLFPLSLASEGSCEIGGNLSTNAGGVQVLRYGNMRELVLGVEVVLPDGRIWDGLRALRKDNTGYDLKQLFIGAEGTLGIVTAVALKLFPRPAARATAWVDVSDPAAAVALLRAVQGACGDRVTAFEIVGREALQLVLKHIPGVRSPFAEVGEWAVLLELSDMIAAEALTGLLEAALAEAFEAGLANDAVIAQSGAQAQALWALRENISEAQRVEGVSIKHDIAVPVSRIAEFLERAGQALLARWPDARIVAFGHIGDGNLHYNLSKADALENGDFIARTPEINRVVHDLVDALGGSISAEHGLGQLKREEITLYRSEVELEMMRALKRTFDPQGLMNPGKVI